MDCRENPTPWPEDFWVDEKRRRVTFTLEDEAGEERHFDLGFEWCVCPTCRGRGQHVNPAIDADHGLTAEDFAQDPDFADDYFSGVYDQECVECGGRRVVPVLECPELEAWRREIYEMRRAEAAERRIGA